MQQKNLLLNKTITLISSLAITLVGYSCNQNSVQDEDFHIYLCFGQSNMEGQAKIEEIDTELNPRFLHLPAVDCIDKGKTKGIWKTAEEPLCQCDTGLSLLTSFGKTMTDNLPENITVGVINVAVGGCDIRLFDKDVFADYDSTYVADWFQNKLSLYDNNPYNHLITLAKSSQEGGIIKGILLHQGESNLGDVNWPNYVSKIYKDILQDLSLEADKVPLIAGELLSAENNCCSSMNTIIHELPKHVTTTHVVSAENCTGQDNAHFDSEGYRELGKRYAMKMLSLGN